MSAAGAAAAAARPYRWQIVFGVVAVGLILRAPIVAVSPLSGAFGADLGMTHAQIGLLTTLPVVCFGLIAPLASFAVGRFGANAATTAAVIGVGVGILLRSAGGIGFMFAGTIITGVFITVGNVVIPVVIHRDVPRERAPLATGSYTAALNIGSTMTALATAPLSLGAGGWRLALGASIVLVVLALVAWIVAVRSGAAGGSRMPVAAAAAATTPASGTESETSGTAPVSEHVAIARPGFAAALLSAAFVGQAFAYYGVTAWLPTIFRDESGFSATVAGAGSSVFQATAIVGALGVPLIAAVIGLTRTTLAVAVLWVVFPLGLLLAPGAWLLWTAIGGVAQAGGITVIFTLVVALARDGVHARRLSATVQGVGYTLGATAPTLLGVVHDATGAWTLPLAVVLVATLLYAVAACWTAVHVTGPRGARA